MSISTTSGSSSATRSRPAWPLGASPTTSMSLCPPSISASADRTSGSSSTSRTRITLSTVATPPARTSHPRCAGRAGRRAARCARAGPTRPRPAPGAALARSPSGLASTHGDARARVAGRADRDLRAGRVLAHVGDALLDDPVDACGRSRAAPASRRRRASVQSTSRPRVLASSTSAAMSSYVGCGRAVAGPGSSSRSTPSTSRSSWSASLAWPWIWPRPSRSRSLSRSSRNASAPACIETWVMRWASTSCISRAMRARSVERACASRRSCSVSARSARVRRFHMTSRREPM